MPVHLVEFRLSGVSEGRSNDAVVTRLKIELMIARATDSPRILVEDRLAILEQVKDLAVAGTGRHPSASGVFSACCKVGINILRYLKAVWLLLARVLSL